MAHITDQYASYYKPIWPILPTNMAHITDQYGPYYFAPWPLPLIGSTAHGPLIRHISQQHLSQSKVLQQPGIGIFHPVVVYLFDIGERGIGVCVAQSL